MFMRGALVSDWPTAMHIARTEALLSGRRQKVTRWKGYWRVREIAGIRNGFGEFS